MVASPIGHSRMWWWYQRRTLMDWLRARKNLERLPSKIEDRIKARILREADRFVREKERSDKPPSKQ